MWLKTSENESYIWDQFKDFLCNHIEYLKHQQFNTTKQFYEAQQKQG